MRTNIPAAVRDQVKAALRDKLWVGTVTSTSPDLLVARLGESVSIPANDGGHSLSENDNVLVCSVDAGLHVVIGNLS